MRATVLASSSAANATLLHAGPDLLLLDAGLTPKDVRRAIAGVARRIDGALLTHEHGDHAQGSAVCEHYGIPLVASAGTLAAIAPTHPHRAVTAEHTRTVRLGRWLIVPFNVRHDAAEPLGFVIAHTTEPGKALYLTDAGKIPGRFAGVTIALVEANYDPALLNARTRSRETAPALAERIERSHLSIYQATQLLAQIAERSPNLETTILLHLSAAHSDAEAFARRARAATGRPVEVAPERHPNLEAAAFE